MLEIVLKLLPPRSAGYSIALGIWFFLAQVVFLTLLAVERYDGTTSSTLPEYIWFVYKEVPSTLPMAAVFSIGSIVLMQVMARFAVSGPTIGELPNWIKENPIRAGFNVLLNVLLIVALVLHLWPLMWGVLGVMLSRMAGPWFDWVADSFAGAMKRNQD